MSLADTKQLILLTAKYARYGHITRELHSTNASILRACVCVCVCVSFKGFELYWIILFLLITFLYSSRFTAHT